MIYIKRWIEHYAELFPIEANQLKFLNDYCDKFPAPAKFLNVEAGPATVSMELADYNRDVTVTDSFLEFTSLINSKQADREQKVHVFNLNPLDIVRYLGKGFFNIIFCTNYRLIFIKDKASIHKFMIDSKMMLSDGGYLILDLINFSKFDFSEPRIDLPVKKSENVHLYSYILRDANSVRYSLNQQLITKEGKKIDEVVDEDITPISFETFKKLSSEIGFSSIEFYSDYFGTPYSEDSEKIICVLKK